MVKFPGLDGVRIINVPEVVLHMTNIMNKLAKIITLLYPDLQLKSITQLLYSDNLYSKLKSKGNQYVYEAINSALAIFWFFPWVGRRYFFKDLYYYNPQIGKNIHIPNCEHVNMKHAYHNVNEFGEYISKMPSTPQNKEMKKLAHEMQQELEKMKKKVNWVSDHMKM